MNIKNKETVAFATLHWNGKNQNHLIRSQK